MKARITKNYYLPSGFEPGDTISIIPNMQADANDVCNAPIDMCYLCKREDGALGYVPAVSLRLFFEEETPINWEQRRYEIAKDVMCAFLRQLKVDRGCLQFPFDPQIPILTEKGYSIC